MVTIEKYEGGYLIGDVVVIGTKAKAKDKITLAAEKGPAMNYGIHDLKTINFPGEYDINNTSVVCVEADDVLSYIIRIDGKQVALLQNSAVLEVANFDGVQERVCADKKIKEELESLELEGDIMVLGESAPAKSDAKEPEKKKVAKNVR